MSRGDDAECIGARAHNAGAGLIGAPLTRVPNGHGDIISKDQLDKAKRGPCYSALFLRAALLLKILNKYVASTRFVSFFISFSHPTQPKVHRTSLNPLA